MSAQSPASGTRDSGGVGCLSRIEHAYGGLAETARRIADSILQQPASAVGLSITDLAHLSGVSDTTVLRFVRGLGYGGYREFALALAAAVLGPGREQTTDHALDVQITEDDDLVAITRKVFAAEAEALAKAWQTISLSDLRDAVDALVGARRVQCYAVGGSGLLAMEAVYRFARLGLDCAVVYDPIQIAIQASSLTAQDVALGFSQTGRTRDTVEGLALARAAGATTICVTSKPRSPIVAVSDIALVLMELHTAYRGALLDSKIAELTLIDALATCLARQITPQHADAVERVEASIERMLYDGATTGPRAPRLGGTPPR